MTHTRMSLATIAAATALAAALEAENDALRAMDVPRALVQFPQKEAQAARLLLALSTSAMAAQGEQDPVPLADARACAMRLQDLAADNRRLLERAMFVQGRLIATLARAASPPRIGYGDVASNRARGSRSVAPLTLSARA